MTKRSKISFRFSNRYLIPVLAGMISFVPLNAHAAKSDSAGLFSSAYLQELCSSNEKGKEIVKGGHTACQAYISGVVDYHKLMKSLSSQPLMDICVPPTASKRRLQDIVWVYLAKNPQHGEFLASPAVTMALYEYYPCPPAGSAKKSTRRKHK